MDYLEKLKEYRDREIEVYSKLSLEDVNVVMNVLDEARLNGNEIYICGNGGSASTASHFCADFNKGINETTSPKYHFECLSDNVATMMAIANDYKYEDIFSYQIKNKMRAGDILIGISGSGNSKNVVNAFETAKENGGKTIAFVGYSGGKLKQIADYSIHIDVNDMQIAEDLHMVLDHMMMSVFCKSYSENRL